MREKEKIKGVTGFKEQEAAGVSPWMLSLLDELGPEKKLIAGRIPLLTYPSSLWKGPSLFGMIE